MTVTRSPSHFDRQLVVRFTGEQLGKIDRAAAEDHRRRAEWVRLEILRALDARDNQSS